MTRRPALFAALFVLLVLAVGVGVGLPVGVFLLRPLAPPTPGVIAVPAGVPFAEVARRLEAGGAVRSAAGLGLLARLRGDTRRVQAGEYAFSAPATPGQVLDRLVAGDVQRVRVTIPEGWTLRQIAAALERTGLAAAPEILRLARDPAFAASLDLSVSSLEGYLFPETYFFEPATPAERLLQTMVRQFGHRLDPALTAAAARLGLDRHQLVTLASIIQKEAGNNAEMPLISAVFHNRLRRGMPLQADPTVIYGIENFNGNLTRRDLEQPTPYNTYRIGGLPPGPIASPGTEALRAAAFPAPADYLYFVARGDGTHAFSATLAEHNRAVRRYQLRRGG